MTKIRINFWWRGRRWSNTNRLWGFTPHIPSQTVTFTFFCYSFLLFSLFFHSTILYVPSSFSCSFSCLLHSPSLPIPPSVAFSFGGECLLSGQTDRTTLTTEDTSKNKRGRIVGSLPPSFSSLPWNKNKK